MKKTIGLISANYSNDTFGELTTRRTLASLPFAGRYRIVDFPLSNMANAGIDTVGLITPHNARSLLDHVGVGRPWGMDKKRGGLFVLPGAVYGMRTKTGKFLMRDLVKNGRFFYKDDADYVILSGSSKIYNMDFKDLIEAHEKNGTPVTFAYTQLKEAAGYEGLFLTLKRNGKIKSATQKPTTGKANYFLDCMIVNRAFLINCTKWYEALDFMSLTEVIVDNLADIEVGTFLFRGYVGVVDNISDYMQVHRDVLQPSIAHELFGAERKIFTRVQDSAPTLYKKGASVKSSLVATGCIIEGEVENSILFRDVTIKPGAVVKNSIVMQHTVIEAGAVIENVVCDKYSSLGSGMQLVGQPDQPLIVSKDQKF